MEYRINQKIFTVIDSQERIPSKDSFTDTPNKIGRGKGAWEWHIGSKNNIERHNFFGGFGFNAKSFLLKFETVHNLL